MLTGTCQKCGASYWGWALNEKRYQTCPKCGSLIKVMEYGKAETNNNIMERTTGNRRKTFNRRAREIRT